jgi:hypothetical protein
MERNCKDDGSAVFLRIMAIGSSANYGEVFLELKQLLAVVFEKQVLKLRPCF